MIAGAFTAFVDCVLFRRPNPVPHDITAPSSASENIDTRGETSGLTSDDDGEDGGSDEDDDSDDEYASPLFHLAPLLTIFSGPIRTRGKITPNVVSPRQRFSAQPPACKDYNSEKGCSKGKLCRHAHRCSICKGTHSAQKHSK
ncbi:hypothetical protein HDZ31DRAFT_69489 [Schizophyllum fasciatum]